jgi:hypothetical protein
MLEDRTQRARRLVFVWLAVYAIFLAATPFEHHDLLCELKTPLHCTACTSSVVGAPSVRLAPLGASSLVDLGVAFTAEPTTHAVVLADSSTGRSPPFPV